MTQPNIEGEPPLPFDDEGLKRLVAAYKDGTGLVALAEQWAVSTSTVRRILVEAGVTIRGRGRPAKK